ncbi:MAG: DUF11 domain-containing protein [Saprospiraceae bacterium]|nr:DUF11 domain-containing protein [Saprospiraceae bacterium]
MKRIYLIFWTLWFAASLSYAQSSFWENAKGPYGGGSQVIYTNSSKLYNWSYNGIFKSIDNGLNWSLITVSEADTTDFQPEYLSIGYTGTFYKLLSYFDGNQVTRKLFISHDEGQTWSLKNDEIELVKIFELPSGVLLGFNQSWDSRLYRSLDEGSTWQLVYNENSSLILGQYSTYAIANDYGIAIIASPTDKEMLLSMDNGLSWSKIEAPSVFSGAPFIHSTGTILSFEEVGSTSGISRSANQGNSWDFIPLNFDLDEQPTSFIRASDDKILLSTNIRIYESTDDGLTWSALPYQPIQANYFAHPFPLPNGDILGYFKGVLHRSDDIGQTWTFSSTGLHSGAITAFKPFDSTNQYALTDYGLWSTSDGGESWNSLITDTSRAFLYSEARLALVNADSFALKMGKSIWASVDAGQSFGQITPPGGLARGNIFASSDGWLLCTSPQGIMTMDRFNGIWNLSMPNAAIIRFAENRTTGKWFIYTNPIDFSSSQNILWQSSDHGQSWSLVQSLDWPNSYLYELRSDLQDRLYVSGYYDHAMRLAISEDGGETWINHVIPAIYTFGELAINRLGHLFNILYDNSGQILASVDRGASWYTLPYFGQSTVHILEVSNDGYLYATDYNGYLVKSSKSTESGAYIHATVNRDADLDCSTPDAQEPLKNWNITVSGEEDYYGTTGENGYCSFYLDTTVYSVKTRVPQALWWSLCDSVQTVEATQPMGSDTVRFVALPLAECPLMSVNVAVPMLRRCFNNTVYINYCNQGTEPADSAWVDVMLDEYLSFISSAQPHESLGNNIYRFYVGDVNSGDCGDFNLTVYVSCDSTVLGQTHCVGAHGFPDTLCTPTPNWSGANIEASVACQDTLIQLKLENTGQAPSSTLEYIIIEDDVVLFTGQKSYAPGESILMDYDANGSTWRIESMQEPGHPFSFLALAFEEGCGGFESLGFINQFPVNGISPSWHRVCVENIGSFDPNDKQGFPTGVGEDHNIRPGQELEYLIRFQNTGTDTAFTVMIRDTLSAFLDPASVRPGASSHPYTWSLSGEGVITFTFNNIHLPDSNINEPASHGFVQFRIAQQTNLPLGCVIENDAAIYFDFNDPIITNTTWHTLYESPLMLATYEAGHNRKQQSLEIWPNPVKDQTNVRLKDASAGSKRVNLYNSTGQILQSLHFTGQETILKCPSLAQGQYWIQVTDVQGRTLGSSVLVKE